MPTKSPDHPCPFADSVTATDAPRIEGRFGKLESEVESLAHGLENVERNVAEGFKQVFSKIDSIGTTRASNTIPWIMVGFAVLGLVATVGFQSVNNVAGSVSKAESNLALSNQRELDYREAKGRAEALAMQLTEQAIDMRKWRLAHTEETAEFRGRVTGRQQMNEERIKVLEEHQYHNSVEINSIDGRNTIKDKCCPDGKP